MRLYNTLSRKTEDFVPLDDSHVGVYSCGPTVYDHIHIGNLSAFIYADTLRRALAISGYDVTHVMNFTDVDDKTIRRSGEQYPDLDANEALSELTTYYGDIFLRDMEQVGNDIERYTFVKATDPEVIDGMQQLIRELHANGFAYIADDGVYFSIDAYRKSGKKYGQLSEISVDSTSEARIQNDEYDKESAHDFALWKKHKTGEPSWAFDLDGTDLSGRPGWHIECSVMSSRSLGQPFDIHTGGIDLIFPHHENEIAQSTAGKDDSIYAKYFVHNEHILVDGKKMSKSLSNFHTLEDIVKKSFDPLAFRLLVLQGHYRSQAHFSWENLEAAQNRLKAYSQFADLIWEMSDGAEHDEVLDEYTQKITAALANDLDTPTVLALLSELESQWVRALTFSKQAFRDFLEFVDAALGLNLSDTQDISDDQYGLIAEREKVREAQNWPLSDEIRDKLTGQGVGLRDAPDGTVWYHL